MKRLALHSCAIALSTLVTYGSATPSYAECSNEELREVIAKSKDRLAAKESVKLDRVKVFVYGEEKTALLREKLPALSPDLGNLVKHIEIRSVREEEQIILEYHSLLGKGVTFAVVDAQFMRGDHPKYSMLMPSGANSRIRSDVMIVVDHIPLFSAGIYHTDRYRPIFIQVSDTAGESDKGRNFASVIYLLEMAFSMASYPSLLSSDSFKSYSFGMMRDIQRDGIISGEHLADRRRIMQECILASDPEGS